MENHQKISPRGPSVAALLGLLALLVLAGCADKGGLEITGNYIDSWGTTQTITATEWNDGYYIFHIKSYRNDQNFLVAQNDAANGFFPDLYSRFDWSWFVGDLYYCQITYDAASAAEAEAVTTADPTDPTAGGCGGPDFTWTRLDPL